MSTSIPAKANQAERQLIFDITRYGAKPGFDSTDAIELAVADATKAATGAGYWTTSTVYIPPAMDSYIINRTIFVDGEYVGFSGDQRCPSGSKLMMLGKHNMLSFGVERQPLRTKEALGVLDSSACRGPGFLRGIKLGGDSFLHFQASPLSAGKISSFGDYKMDHWEQTDRLTIEFMIESGTGREFPVGNYILGMGSSNEIASWRIRMGMEPNQIFVDMQTKDTGPGYEKPYRNFSFSLGSGPGPFRVTVQIDFRELKFSAFCNGKSCRILHKYNLDNRGPNPIRPRSGVTLCQNRCHPFFIGHGGISGMSGAYNGFELTLWGLKISDDIIYQHSEDGSDQKRLDGLKIEDRYRYFSRDKNTIACLPMTVSPLDDRGVVEVWNGDASGVVGMSSGVSVPCNGMGRGGRMGNFVQDLFLIAGNGGGQCISLGGVLETFINRVKLFAGYNGIGSWSRFASYKINVSDCFFNCYGSNYFGYQQIASIKNSYCLNSSRITFNLVGTTASIFDTIVARPSSDTRSFLVAIGAEYGGRINCGGVSLIDYEGDAFNSEDGVFVIEPHHYLRTIAKINDFDIGTIGEGVPIFRLADRYPQKQSVTGCTISSTGFQAYTDKYKLAVVEGPSWSGVIDSSSLSQKNVHYEGPKGTKCGVSSVDLMSSESFDPKTSDEYVVDENRSMISSIFRKKGR